MADSLYDRIGATYEMTRRPDPRIEAAVHAALGDARSVLNVGAGTGAYEPRDRDVVAVDPSAVMLAQRHPDAAPAIQARAESLPFDDGSFDVAMAVLSDHHWEDRPAGLRELRRVADRIVLFNARPEMFDSFWLNRDYLSGFAALIPERYRRPGAWEEELDALLGPVRLDPVPLPHDCTDGFYGAYWRRPHAYLDPCVRRGISVFSRLDEDEVADTIARLRADLASGAWAERYQQLLELEELDLGYRVVIAGSD